MKMETFTIMILTAAHNPSPAENVNTNSAKIYQMNAGADGRIKGERRMKYTYSVVHALVECEDCGWTTESYKNAQAIAKIHAQKYGHIVRGELGISFGYYGRDEE